MNKLYYTWNNFEEDCKYLVEYCKENNITHLVTLYRGGLPLGVTLSNRLKLPLSIIDYQSYDGGSKEASLIKNAGINKYDKLLILDDIADTGNSLYKAIHLLDEYCKELEVFTLYGSINHPKDWKYCNEHLGEWIVFPWEDLMFKKECSNCSFGETCNKNDLDIHCIYHNKSYKSNHYCLEYV